MPGRRIALEDRILFALKCDIVRANNSRDCPNYFRQCSITRNEGYGMRGGILSPIAPEQIGGGYTFEQEIFSQILELAPASRHEFVIFENFRGAKPGNRSSNFRYVSLKRPFIDRLVLRKRRFSWEHQWIDGTLQAEKFEFFLNTTFEAVTLSIPFLAIVWDLEHRLQPFFPEVSANGMLEHREKYYSQVLKHAAFVIVGTNAGKKEVQMFYGVPDDKIKILPHPTPSFALENNAAVSDDL